MKLITQVSIPRLDVELSLQDGITLLGSCFSDEIGSKMADAGFNICANPFGTLYNPASIAAAVKRLDSAKPYDESDCVQVGAGSCLFCSFEHHTSFARKSAELFLENANARLSESVKLWKNSNKAVITLGTAFVWEHRDAGIVANCLKRDAKEFTRRMLDVDICAQLLASIVNAHPEKEFIFTVSPIRHLSQGAHENTLSKSTLHLAVQRTLEEASAKGIRAAYFPAWEILSDELRDYRFYGDDLVHPSQTAIGIIWERLLEAAVRRSDMAGIAENEKTARRAAHRPLNEL